MALKKLTVPGVNPGGVDKLYGEDWNLLINALTGLATEPITLLGTLTVKSQSGFVQQNPNTPGAPGTVTQSFWQGKNGSGTIKNLFEQDVYLDTITAGAEEARLRRYLMEAGVVVEYQRVNVAGNRRFDITAHDFALDATKKLYLDGGSDTYIHQVSNDVIEIVTAGGAGLSISGSAVAVKSGHHVTIPATEKLYLDGGGDTYLYESGANVVDLFVGGVQMAQINNSVWDFNSKKLRNIANSNNTGVSGTPKTINVQIGGVDYYFLVYPTSSA